MGFINVRMVAARDLIRTGRVIFHQNYLLKCLQTGFGNRTYGLSGDKCFKLDSLRSVYDVRFNIPTLELKNQFSTIKILSGLRFCNPFEAHKFS